jgi:hypothetical protein
MTSVKQVAHERALRGLAWLKGPGTELGFDVNRIQMSTLDMASPYACTLSQASGFGHFPLAMNRAGWVVKGENQPGWKEWALEHGFVAICGCGCNVGKIVDLEGVDYDVLTAAWKYTLTEDRVLSLMIDFISEEAN